MIKATIYVGPFEAKTPLSSLLYRVAIRIEITITNNRKSEVQLLSPSRMIKLIMAMALAGLAQLGVADLALSLAGSASLFAAHGLFGVLSLDAKHNVSPSGE